MQPQHQIAEYLRQEWRKIVHDLWPVVLAVIVFLVVTFVLMGRAQAAHPWTPEVAARVVDMYPMVVGAAHEFQVDPVELAAQSAAETGLQAVRGRYAPVWGPGQINWGYHGGMIRAAGIAKRPEQLLDMRTGLRAQALVMRSLQLKHPRRRALCAYGVGWKPIAEKWTDCRYSRAVDRRVPKVLYAVESSLRSGLGPLLATLRRWFTARA